MRQDGRGKSVGYATGMKRPVIACAWTSMVAPRAVGRNGSSSSFRLPRAANTNLRASVAYWSARSYSFNANAPRPSHEAAKANSPVTPLEA